MSDKPHGRSYGIQTPPSFGVPGKKRYAMVIDLRRCTGCGSCVVACKAEHDVPLGVWRVWLKVVDKGRYPHVHRVILPRLCNHCDYPICVRHCPVQATYKHESGFVLQRYNRCIGCRTCMIACPYNARHLLPRHRTDPKKPNSVADKCDFCIHRVTRGLAPTCVATCVGGAMIFGDVNDPESEVAKVFEGNRVTELRSEIGTEPQVHYIGMDEVVAEMDDSYIYRSQQTKDEFDTFKLNHKGQMHADIIEGETGFLGMWRQMFRNQWGFVKEIPEKMGLIKR